MSARTLYEIMDLEATATADEIRESYRLLASAWHPDKHGGTHKDRAEEKLKHINEAYQVLKDPEQRAAYDESLRGSKADPAPAPAATPAVVSLRYDGVYWTDLDDGVLAYIKFYKDGTVYRETSKETDPRFIFPLESRLPYSSGWAGKWSRMGDALEFSVSCEYGTQTLKGKILNSDLIELDLYDSRGDFCYRSEFPFRRF